MIKINNIMAVFLSILLGINLSFSQTHQMYNGDTINMVDVNNMKQGHWIFFGKMKRLPEYKPDQKVEEGGFINSRKQGLWTKYFASSNVMSEITYVNSRPNGPYKVYYDNGQVQEEGVWKNNRNVNKFVRYYENGVKQQEFNFTTSGKREGQQKYYHENGEVMIEGNWNGGKENGPITEYYDNGKVKSVKYFNEGGIDAAKTELHPENDPGTKKELIADEPDPMPEEPKDPPIKGGGQGNKPRPKNPSFVEDGNHVLMNKNKQVSQQGEFKGGKLYDGKKYKYDENGLLTNIYVYKKGKYWGEAPIEE